MVYIILLFLLIFNPVYAQPSNTYTIEAGDAFSWSNDNKKPKNRLIAASLRHYLNDNTFLMVKLSRWDRGEETYKSGIMFTGNIGYRTQGRWFIEGALGYGYLNNPDGREVEDGYLTKHQQFEVNLGGGYKINTHSSILFGVTHWSNCHKVCDRGESSIPNKGRDFFRIAFEERF